MLYNEVLKYLNPSDMKTELKKMT